MINSETVQMIYRYLRRRKGYILLFILTLGCLYILSGGLDSLSEYREDYDTNCKFPCYGNFCPTCETTVPPTVKVVNIAEHLKLKQALRSFQRQSRSSYQNVSSTEQVCKRPNFDLNHDSVKYAFFDMKALNCSKEELFYIDNGVFRMKREVLGDRQLEKCEYYGVERITDDFASYTDPLTKTSEPYDVVLMHDFVRIKCFLKKDETETNKDDLHMDLEENSKEKGQDGTADDVVQNDKDNTDKLANMDKSGEKFADSDKNQRQISDNYVKLKADDKNNSKISINGTSRTLTPMDNRVNGAKSPNAGIDVQGVLRHSGQRKLARYVEENHISNNDDIDDDDDTGDVKHDDDADEDYSREYWYDMYKPDVAADFDQLLVQIYPQDDIIKPKDVKLTQSLKSEEKMNVLMFGLDSMSHLSYQRKLPLTYKYLKEELGAVVMDGYNIVGDATTAALLPMLTGKTEVELPEARRNRWESEPVDAYPLIWKNYKSKGYVTLFAEDEPTIGVFNLRLNGFRDKPTDHYMRPFWQALWDTELRTESPRFCTGNVPNHMYLLNYVKDMFVKYHNVSKFAFAFGSELTHWDNNPGEYMDSDFVDFFKFLKERGHLDNTVVVAFADHGARYSRVRKTVQGKMEERLPFMSVALPKRFREKYPHIYKNLKLNSDKLTTPFDIHETLLDILDTQRLKSSQTLKQRGLSLLRPIPADRTCTDAHIQMHWCTCLKQVALDASDKYVQKSVNTLVQFINKETESQRHLCSELGYQSLVHAFLLVPNEKVLMFQKSWDADNRFANFSSDIMVDHAHFQVTIETQPNKGLYESTIQVNMTSGEYSVIEGEVSRLDMYGSQPACVQEKYPDLRKYCYCKKQANHTV